MNSIHHFKFNNVWGNYDELLHTEVVRFWDRNNVLSEQQRQDRLKELVFVLRNKEGEIIGVATASKTFHDRLKNYVYLYRCYITKEYRAPGVETKLTKMTRDYLESIYKSEEPRAVGFVIVAQAEILKKWNKAVWPGLDMMYIGNTRTGDPVRIYYFKGVRI